MIHWLWLIPAIGLGMYLRDLMVYLERINQEEPLEDETKPKEGEEVE